MVFCMSILVPVAVYALVRRSRGQQAEWLRHSANKVVVLRIFFEALFAFGLLYSNKVLPSRRLEPSCIHPERTSGAALLSVTRTPSEPCFEDYALDCKVPGLLSQIGVAGSIGYFFSSCLDLGWSVFDPFKEQNLRWWHHIFPLTWIVLSCSLYRSSGEGNYGLSAAQFCWFQVRGINQWNPMLWIATYVPSLVALTASVAALVYAHYCKQFFPNWHQDHRAFVMHNRFVLIFAASFAPLAATWYAYFAGIVSDTPHLMALLGSTFVCKDFMEFLLWWGVILAKQQPKRPEEDPPVPNEFKEQQRRFIQKKVQEGRIDLGDIDATEYFLRLFVAPLWRQYRQLVTANRAQKNNGLAFSNPLTDPDETFVLLRYSLWYQLLVIWEKERKHHLKDETLADAILAKFLEDPTTGGKSNDGYMSNMKRDYITAVELALFHIAIRQPPAHGFVTPGSEKGNNFQQVPGFSSATFNDYGTNIFAEIHSLCGIDRTSYAKSVCKLQPISHAGGTSVKMLLTHDARYIVKQLTTAEKDKFVSIASGYYQHLRDHPESKIARILGVHAIRMHAWSKSIHFCVMANADMLPAVKPRSEAELECIAHPTSSIFFSPSQASQPVVMLKFDLKGSWISRHVDLPVEDIRERLSRGHSSPSAPTVKDMNLEECNRAGIATIDPEMVDPLLATLKADAMFLRNVNIMDYSLLLLLFHEQSHRSQAVIIDYLQDYNLQKRGERLVKSIRKCHWKFGGIQGFSAIPPGPYADRFVYNLGLLLRGQAHSEEVPPPLRRESAEYNSI
eukprot:TRINITY_DN8526_c0_g1_i1.p1 TRINITY_DN8526_c0_g1~~TRINITY_DN8526_c0_g1_i1.p1  ORF type:complete len:857 (+),score=151.51 TRINITY_DN8526_c0_g1_i1:208-2571(+)